MSHRKQYLAHEAKLWGCRSIKRAHRWIARYRKIVRKGKHMRQSAGPLWVPSHWKRGASLAAHKRFQWAAKRLRNADRIVIGRFNSSNDQTVFWYSRSVHWRTRRRLGGW